MRPGFQNQFSCVITRHVVLCQYSSTPRGDNGGSDDSLVNPSKEQAYQSDAANGEKRVIPQGREEGHLLCLGVY